MEKAFFRKGNLRFSQFWFEFPGIMIILAVCYLLLLAYYLRVLNYDFLRGDVLGYWEDSLNWRTPFHPNHVPGYPLMIAFLRGATLGIIKPTVIMHAINLSAFLVCVILIYKIFGLNNISHKVAAVGIFMFALWPFVGLVYTVTPLADMPAIALLIAGLYFQMKKRVFLSCFLFGLTLITHKALWPFVGAICLFYLFDFRLRLNVLVLAVLLVLFPLGFLWLTGWFYHGSPMWLISSNISKEFVSRGNSTVLDGLFGTLSSGGIIGLVKFLAVAGVLLLGLVLIIIMIRSKPINYRLALALSIPVVLLVLALNQYEIWAAVRFSRLLVLPIIWGCAEWNKLGFPFGKRVKTIAVGSFLILCFFSQFIYAWYMATIYYG